MRTAISGNEREKKVRGTYFDITGNFTILWKESADVDWTWAWIAGDLDGDGSDDVIVHLYKYVSATGTRTKKVIAKKGSDGTHLWEESITTTSPDYGYIWAHPAGDLNGDGSDDVLVHQYKYDYTTDTYTETVIAKRGFDGNHLWEATSDEYIWTAMPYYPYHNYTEPKGVSGEPMEWGLVHRPTPTPIRYEPYEWGYDLNGDGIDDVVLGSSNTIYALTYSPGPKIEISTDKTSYKAGEKMHLGLNVTNPGEKQKVSIKIWLETPTGRTFTLMDTYVTLPAALDYSNPNFKVFKLPNIPAGTYVWHAVLDYPATGEILSEDTAIWNFVSIVAPIEDITKALPPCTTIEFGEFFKISPFIIFPLNFLKEKKGFIEINDQSIRIPYHKNFLSPFDRPHFLRIARRKK